MGDKEFDIYFRKERDPRTYRAHVSVLFRTANIIRYRIRAGEKEFMMEKLLFRKSNQWKVDRLNFIRPGYTRFNEKLVIDIQAAIDREMEKR